MTASAAVPRLLVVNGDDFGYSDAINAAIVRCHRDGILTSTSLLVNQPATRAALALAGTLPTLGVGLHLNLTDGVPVLPPRDVPTLTDRHGHFLPLALLLARLITGRVRADDLQRELRAQLAIVLDAGLCPTHIDGHLHVHALPVVYPLVLDLLAEYGIRALRSPLLGAWAAGWTQRGARSAERLLPQSRFPLMDRQLAWLAPVLARALPTLEGQRMAQLQHAGLTYPAALFDAASVLTAPDPPTALVAAVSAAPGDLIEVMTHPAWNRNAVRGAAEVALLTAPQLHAMLDSHHVRLGHYGSVVWEQDAANGQR